MSSGLIQISEISETFLFNVQIGTSLPHVVSIDLKIHAK